MQGGILAVTTQQSVHTEQQLFRVHIAFTSKAGLLNRGCDDSLVAQQHVYQLRKGGFGDAQLALQCYEDLNHGGPGASQIQVK